MARFNDSTKPQINATVCAGIGVRAGSWTATQPREQCRWMGLIMPNGAESTLFMPWIA